MIKVLDVHLRIAGMSRSECAKKAGVAERTAFNYWSGKRDPLVIVESMLEVVGLKLKVGAL